MDPQATWGELLRAWIQHDWERVVELADALLEWLEKGGFPPEFCYPLELGVEFNAATARAACEFARQRAYSVLDDPHRIPRDVPFTLTCCVCNNQGPDSSSQALDEGWKRIQHVPASAFENFVGICPICQAENCWADQSTC